VKEKLFYIPRYKIITATNKQTNNNTNKQDLKHINKLSFVVTVV